MDLSMKVVSKGSCPETSLINKLIVWENRVRHFRCGTVVEVDSRDVQTQHDPYGGGMAAWVVCPVCSRQHNNDDSRCHITLGWWNFPIGGAWAVDAARRQMEGKP